MFHDFDLFLFDFDGLLVNTEEMHLEAYRKALSTHHLSLHWTFVDFCRHAHYSATGMREGLSKHFPILKQDDLLWTKLYQLKTETYLSFLDEGKISLMPGVETFLNILLDRGATVAVVTHSQKRMIDAVVGHQEVLQKIKHWITREDYKEAKPSPDSYQTAIRRLSKGGKAIGFEDSPRGLQALIGSGAQAVWVSSISYPEMEKRKEEGVLIYPSFEKILEDIPL